MKNLSVLFAIALAPPALAAPPPDLLDGPSISEHAVDSACFGQYRAYTARGLAQDDPAIDYSGEDDSYGTINSDYARRGVLGIVNQSIREGPCTFDDDDIDG